MNTVKQPRQDRKEMNSVKIKNLECSLVGSLDKTGCLVKD